MPLPYRPDIDGLRAFAVLAVLAFHAFPDSVPGGFSGVDIFFVISGYLITRDIRARQSSRTFSLLDFYARRARRLFPALVTVLLTVVVFGWFVLYPNEFSQLVQHAVTSAAFTQNFRLLAESGYFDTSSALKPLLHLWSLAIEEQFYLLWPLLLLVTRQPLAWAVGVVAASFVANLSLVDANPAAAYYLPLTRFWQIAVGAVVALRAPTLTNGRAHVAGLVGAALCIGSALLLAAGAGYPGWIGVAPTVGAALLIAAGPQSFASRPLCLPLPVFVGRISYPLYLWHWPILAYVRIIHRQPTAGALWAALAAAVLLSIATYAVVERPLRGAARAHAKVKGLATALAVFGALCAAISPVAADVSRINGNVSRNEAMIADLVAPHVRGFASCDASLGAVASRLTACVQSGAPTIALLGDSHAVHLFPALATSDPTNGWLLAAKSSCPPLMGVRVSGPKFDCGADMEDAIRYVARDPHIDTAVLSFFGGYLHETDYAFDHVKSDYGPSVIRMSRPNASNKASAMLDGLRDAVRHLLLAGKHVVLVVDNPELPFSPRDCVARPLAHGKVDPCGIDVAAMQARQSKLRAAIGAVHAEFPALRVFDTASVLCDRDMCMVDRGGMLAYYDSHHLSARGSRLVAESLTPWMRIDDSR